MLTLIISSLKMKLRDRSSLFYAIVFPMIFLTVFSLFDMEQQGDVNVVLIVKHETNLTEAFTDAMEDIDILKITKGESVDAHMDDIRSQVQDVILEIEDTSNVYPHIAVRATYQKQQESVVAGALVAIDAIASEISQEILNMGEIVKVKKNILGGKESGYFDFIFPGILGMGLMTYAIFNAGIYVARMKENEILKRLMVTPLSAANFFASQTLTYMLISTIQVTIIIVFAVYLFGAHIYGSVPLAFGLAMMGNLIFVNIGFMVAAVSKSVNSAEGLANIIVMPMMFLSGTFFDTDLLPPLLSQAVQYLPLTPLLDSLRAVVIDAKGPGEIANELALLCVWFVGSYVLLARVFKFAEE